VRQISPVLESCFLNPTLSIVCCPAKVLFLSRLNRVDLGDEAGQQIFQLEEWPTWCGFYTHSPFYFLHCHKIISIIILQYSCSRLVNTNVRADKTLWLHVLTVLKCRSMVRGWGEGVRRWLLAVERDPKVLESLERCCDPSSYPVSPSCDTDNAETCCHPCSCSEKASGKLCVTKELGGEGFADLYTWACGCSEVCFSFDGLK